MDLKLKLERLGLFIQDSPDEHQAYVNIINSKKNDFFIAISYSGSTKSVQEMLKLAAEKKMKTLLITKNNYDNFSGVSHILEVYSNDLILRNVSTSSRIALLVMVDLIVNKIYLSDVAKYKKILEETSLKKISKTK